MKKIYHAIGLMSGSSLDGLDVAYCRFETERHGEAFHLSQWELLQAETLQLSPLWQLQLKQLPGATAIELAEAHVAFGQYLGELVQSFFIQKKIDATKVDLIASHGHTIFHEPARGFTLQIGDGAALSTGTGCATVCDFRSSDVALGGQGAPLAPMADKMLYPGYDFYLNIGGIANIACNADGRFIAFDVTGANQPLNALANLLGQPYDKGGGLAAIGCLHELLFEKLNHLPYLSSSYPKSLSNQWVQENIVEPSLRIFGPVEDRLHTVCRHIAFQLRQSLLQVIENEGFTKEKYQMLATGGGVFNDFLMRCIREENPAVEVVIPSGEVIGFKEACLMALLGVMRLEGVPNCISSVTGAKMDAIGGAVYLPGSSRVQPAHGIHGGV